MAGTTLPRRPARSVLRPLARARVLIAHADPSLRARLRTSLQRADLPVVAEATDGAEAIALTASHRPSAVILGHEMPLRRGVDALPRIRRLVPHALICVYAPEGSAVADLARRRGADSVIRQGEVDAMIARVSDHFAITL